MRIALVLTALAFASVVLPHALEDFAYGQLEDLGIAQPWGVAILAGSLTLVACGIVLVIRGIRLGAWILGVVGGIWCVGAIVIHGHDLLFAGSAYRHGLVSRALEGLIIVLGGAVVVLAGAVLRRSMPQPAR
jgi:hypothetical protein